MVIAGLLKWIRNLGIPPIECEHCGATEGVALEPGMTAYAYGGAPGGPLDPNRDQWFCRPCAKHHHDYWTEMWREYYLSQGIG